MVLENRLSVCVHRLAGCALLTMVSELSHLLVGRQPHPLRADLD